MIRSTKERILQASLYEFGGIAFAAPLYALVFDASSTTSILLMFMLSVVCSIWYTIFNTLFDRVEWKATGQTASNRTTPLRVVHAAFLEISSIIVSVPVIMYFGHHSFLEAVLIDIGLSVFYVGYAYLFHLIFDYLRPVQFEELNNEL